MKKRTISKFFSLEIHLFWDMTNLFGKRIFGCNFFFILPIDGGKKAVGCFYILIFAKTKGFAISLDFSPVNTFVQRMIKTENENFNSVCDKYNVLCVSGSAGLQVTKTPGKPTFLVSNLTGLAATS